MMMESGKFKNNGNCTDIVLSATRLDLKFAGVRDDGEIWPRGPG